MLGEQGWWGLWGETCVRDWWWAGWGDYHEVCDVGEADEWRWAGRGLWSPSIW